MKTVYTQEMKEAGEKIKVGMLFNGFDYVKNVFAECTALSISQTSKGDDILTYEYECCSIDVCWLNDSWVKPIDSRTDKEKAFDDLEAFLEYVYPCDDYGSKDMASSISQFILEGGMHKVSFTGNK